jgi:hypothetical protein
LVHGNEKQALEKASGKEARRQGGKDHIITVSKPRHKPEWMEQTKFDLLPDTISVREFSAKGKIYVTTLEEVNLYSKR